MKTAAAAATAAAALCLLAACVETQPRPPAVTATLPPTTTTTTTTIPTTTTTTAAAAAAVLPPDLPAVCALDEGDIREMGRGEIEELQREVGTRVDGQWGPNSKTARWRYCAQAGFAFMPAEVAETLVEGFSAEEWEVELPPIGEDCKWAYYDPTPPDCPGGEWGYLVSPLEAHRSSAAGWDISRKQEFAADPDNLFATSPQTLTAKADKDPAKWRPPVRSSKIHCLYIHDWMKIKNKYGLNANKNERSHLYTALNNYYDRVSVHYHSSVCG